MSHRIAKQPTLVVREWERLLLRAAKAEHIYVSLDLATRLAAYLSLVGSVRDIEAQRAFWAFKSLFLNKKRIGRWDVALHAIPPTREAVLHIADCCFQYGRVGGEDTLARATFTLDRVVSVMMKIRNPKAYMDNAAKSNFLIPASLFHPNTLKAAEKRMRGALGVLSRDQSEHNAQVATKVTVYKTWESDE